MTTGDEPHVATPAGRRRWRIPAIAFLVIVVVSSVGAAATRGPLFPARAIRVVGAEHLSRADVLRIAGIDGGTNVFTLDAGAAERRLMRDRWIADATVTKDLPTTIEIVVREHTPVAVTGSANALRLVAEDGALLGAAADAVMLPRIGPADPAAGPPDTAWVNGAAKAVAAMAPVLRRQVSLVAILADGQLRVDLRSGAQVVYGPPEDVISKAKALRALLRWAAVQRTAIRSADIRVPSAPTARLA